MLTMMWHIKNRFSDEDFIRVCSESKSMAKAASVLGLHFNSFKKRAIELACYRTNQSGIGFPKSKTDKIPIDEILDGRHPHFQTYKLKLRLIKDRILVYKCANCEIDTWKGKIINLELDHIDGNRLNHRLENLRLLCPNCHSQTSTYRAKNRIKKI